jgi:hypothetical protein
MENETFDNWLLNFQESHDVDDTTLIMILGDFIVEKELDVEFKDMLESAWGYAYIEENEDSL